MQEQSVENIQIVIVDDASTDASMDIGEALAKEDRRVRYFRLRKRGGAAKCRNLGNTKVNAPLIHVADTGDIYHIQAARMAIDYFRRHKDVDIFYSSVGILDERSRMRGVQRAVPYKAGEKINFSHPTIVYTRKIAKKKYREVSVHTDAYEAFFLEAALKGAKFGFVNDLLVLKRDIETDGSSRNMKEAWKVKRGIYKEFGLKWPFGKEYHGALPDAGR